MYSTRCSSALRARGVADGGDYLLQLERLLDEVVPAVLHRGDRASIEPWAEIMMILVSGASCRMPSQRPRCRRRRPAPDPAAPTSGRSSWNRAQASLPDAATVSSNPSARACAHRLPDQRFVVGDQDLDAHRITEHAADGTSNDAPALVGGRLRATIRPPCSSTMFWLTASPRPWPPGLVVKNGLNSRGGAPPESPGPDRRRESRPAPPRRCRAGAPPARPAPAGESPGGVAAG